MRKGKINIVILGIVENKELFVALKAIAEAYKVNYAFVSDNLKEIAKSIGLPMKGSRTIHFFISPTSYYIKQSPTLYVEGDETVIPYAENTPKGWFDAIETMILYPDVRNSVIKHQNGRK